jgi:hypothetical protein
MYSVLLLSNDGQEGKGVAFVLVTFGFSVQILSIKLLEFTFICIKPKVHIMSEPAAIIILVQRPFLPTVLRHLILAHWAMYQVESKLDTS